MCFTALSSCMSWGSSGQFLPLVGDFKLDAFGQDSFAASVSAVDAELELLFKLWAAGVFNRVGFVSLGFLLNTHTDQQT